MVNTLLQQMRVAEVKLEAAISMLEGIDFEFDEELDVSEIYLDQYPKTSLHEIVEHLQHQLNEVRSAVTEAILDNKADLDIY